MRANYTKRITNQTDRIRRIAAALPAGQRHALLNACGTIELNARRASYELPERDNRTLAAQSEQVAEQYNTAQRIIVALLSGRVVSQRNSEEFKTTAFHSRMADVRRILTRQHPELTLCSQYSATERTEAGRPYKLYWINTNQNMSQF